MSKKPTYPHKLASTAEAVQASAAVRQLRAPTLLWVDRDHRAEFVSEGEQYDFSSLRLIIPYQRDESWPRTVSRLNAILDTRIVARRATYIARTTARHDLPDAIELVGPPPTHSCAEGVDFPDDVNPGVWGYSVLLAGRGRMPYGLTWILSCRGRGQEASEKLYGAVLRMRSHARPPVGKPSAPDRRSPQRAFKAWYWEGSKSGMRPREWARAIDLSPDVWIRRRPIRRDAGAVSLSIFGLDRGTNRLRDLTLAVASACAEPWETLPGGELTGEQWRRALFIVDRGDSLEWIVPLPSRAQPVEPISMEEAARLGVPRRAGYAGTPLFALRETLHDLLKAPPRFHWIREDKPLKGESPIQ